MEEVTGHQWSRSHSPRESDGPTHGTGPGRSNPGRRIQAGAVDPEARRSRDLTAFPHTSRSF